jgi:hypothetical protein
MRWLSYASVYGGSGSRPPEVAIAREDNLTQCGEAMARGLSTRLRSTRRLATRSASAPTSVSIAPSSSASPDACSLIRPRSREWLRPGDAEGFSRAPVGLKADGPSQLVLPSHHGFSHDPQTIIGLSPRARCCPPTPASAWATPAC